MHFQELLLLDEMHSEGLVKSQLRPKPDDCEITVTDITATWNKVYTTQYL